ncbi:CBO0543 family protein [Desulfosporosinus sp. SB140]|uniref:CBO0543 family protein n=1 Tax=Desulfosporosinus paludis TaxID=3115649 RepID=UPI00388D4385
MLDFHLILSLISILIAWKWGDWRNWKLYYPTILYFIIGDLCYIILSNDKPLWKYESPVFSSDFIECLIAFIVFPCSCLVFFQIYAKVNKIKIKIKWKGIAYTLFFLFGSSIYTFAEWLSFKLGSISYHNGWNLYWSFGFNYITNGLLLLHFKKPLWVWIPSIFFASLMIYLFHFPFTIFK